jgi:subtilase family serine protease
MSRSRDIRGRRPARRAAWAIAASAAVLACVPALRSAAPAAPALAAVGSVPHLPGRTIALGRLAPGAQGTLRLDVVLRSSDADALRALARGVSTPGSPSFRRFLSPAQFAARFGASAKTLATVIRSLRSRGLQVTGVSENRLIVHVRGTTQRIERAFGVSLARYRLPGGSIAFANTTAPRLPGDVAALVSQIVGLDSLARPAPAGLARARRATAHEAAARAPATAAAGPQASAACAQQIAAAGQNDATGLVSTSDIAQAYDFSDLYQAGNFGQGSTIALIEFSSFIPADIATFATCYGVTPHINEIPVDGGVGPPVTFGPDEAVSNQLEAELDIEAIVGLAPDATIDVYETSQDLGDSSAVDVLTEAIDNPDVQVISTSWGHCEAETDQDLTGAEATLFEQAATEGKTIVAAAGDYGSEDCFMQGSGAQRTHLAVDDPASQPFVTGVGGTSFVTLGPPPSAVVWNTPNSGATGGGVSTLQAMPGYQSGAPAALGVVTTFSTCGNSTGRCREVPDVAAYAAPSFATYCTEGGRDGCDPGGWTGFGGTSLAAPIWGSLFALANASPACASKRIGFANPALYAIAGGAGYAGAFTDVTQGNNDLGYQNGLYPAGPGYDLATGLGTPIAGAGTGGGGGLVDQLCGTAGAVPVTTVTLAAPDAGPLRGGTKVTIDGSGFTGATAVRFGTKKAVSYTVVSAGTIVAIAPKGTGTVSVTVTTSLGTSSPAAEARFRYLAVPAVARLSPAAGPARGGTVVSVTGSGFVEVRAVRFGARAARSFRVISPSRIAAVAPAGAGTAAVAVTTPGGTSRKAPRGLFRST